MKYRGIFEYEYPTEHKPPVSIDVHLHGDCVKGKIIEWEYRPLEPEPKTGHWILTDVEGYRVWHCNCSKCNKDPLDFVGGSENWWLIKTKLPKYCPNCSAKMVEPHESEA